jgi:hypothetical protein
MTPLLFHACPVLSFMANYTFLVFVTKHRYKRLRGKPRALAHNSQQAPTPQLVPSIPKSVFSTVSGCLVQEAPYGQDWCLCRGRVEVVHGTGIWIYSPKTSQGNFWWWKMAFACIWSSVVNLRVWIYSEHTPSVIYTWSTEKQKAFVSWTQEANGNISLLLCLPADSKPFLTWLPL